MPVIPDTMWTSLEFTAKIQNCSCSRLAIKGGLNSTLFNKSKRCTKFGNHWLSFGSILNALNGSNMNLLEFAVIYVLLDEYPKFDDTQQMREIIAGINSHMQQYLKQIKQQQIMAQISDARE